MVGGSRSSQVRDSLAGAGWYASCSTGQGGSSMDVFYLGLAVGFFAISWALVVACERL
jgi:hypothetical protein